MTEVKEKPKRAEFDEILAALKVTELEIGSVSHEVIESAYHLLKTRQGEPFIVYYAAHSKAFLSLEPASRKAKEAE